MSIIKTKSHRLSKVQVNWSIPDSKLRATFNVHYGNSFSLLTKRTFENRSRHTGILDAEGWYIVDIYLSGTMTSVTIAVTLTGATLSRVSLNEMWSKLVCIHYHFRLGVKPYLITEKYDCFFNSLTGPTTRSTSELCSHDSFLANPSGPFY